LSLDFVVMGSVHITLSQRHDPQSLYTMQACEYCRIMYRVCTWSLGLNPKVYDEHLSITVASWFNLCCRVSILLQGQQLNLSRWCSTVCCIGGGLMWHGVVGAMVIIEGLEVDNSAGWSRQWRSSETGLIWHCSHAWLNWALNLLSMLLPKLWVSVAKPTDMISAAGFSSSSSTQPSLYT